MSTNQLIFSCTTKNPRFVAQALMAIAWKDGEDQYCSASVNDGGILFLTEDCSSIQASVLLRPPIFSNFIFVREESFDFRINLTKFVKCIKLFNDTASQIEIKAKTESEILIEITDDSRECRSVTECAVRTLYYQPQPDDERAPLSKVFSNQDSPEVAEFSLKSNIVREMFVFPEMSQRSAIPITMTVDHSARVFEVKAEGSFGTVRSSMDFGLLMAQKPKFDLVEPLTASYPISSLVPVLKAMALSSDTSFIFKGNGMLSVQNAISNQTVGTVITVVEFILQPIGDTSTVE